MLENDRTPVETGGQNVGHIRRQQGGGYNRRPQPGPADNELKEKPDRDCANEENRQRIDHGEGGTTLKTATL